MAVAGERPGRGSIVACGVLAVGVLLIVAGNLRDRTTRRAAVAVGLSAALAWALGELFMKLAGPRGGVGGNVAASAVMVWGGTLAFLPAAVPYLLARRASLAPGPWLAMFPLHGLLSYATAYLCFFASLAQLGLARTVAVTAAWPLLSLLTAAVERRTAGERSATPRYLVVASCVLLVGAVIEIWFGG